MTSTSGTPNSRASWSVIFRGLASTAARMRAAGPCGISPPSNQGRRHLWAIPIPGHNLGPGSPWPVPLLALYCIPREPARYNAPMFLFRKPSVPAIHAFLDSQARLDFTYPAVGATAAEPPPGYVVDHTRIRLGAGRSTFIAAQAALRSW